MASESEYGCKIVAFYSYKGGVGRSLLAANVASVLAMAGKKVLLVDWDLEAPGIGDFFDHDPAMQVPETWRSNLGVLDLIRACDHSENLQSLVAGYLADDKPDPARIRIQFKGLRIPAGGELHLLGPGRRGGLAFVEAVGNSQWANFFERYRDGLYEGITGEVKKQQYHFVIVDTRTGINRGSEFAVHMADLVVFVSTLSSQSLEGTHVIWQRTRDLRGDTSPQCSGLSRLVLSRYSRGELEEFKDSVMAVIDDKNPFKLPYLATMPGTEKLFVFDQALRDYIFSEQRPLDVTDVYRDSFWSLCGEIANQDVRGLEIWRGIVPELRAATEEIARRAPAAHRSRQGLELVEELIAEIEKSTGEAAPRPRGSGPGENVTDEGSVPRIVDALDKWIKIAAYPFRNAARAHCLQLLKAREKTLADLPQGARQALRIDIWLRPEDPERGSNPNDANKVREVANRLWREGVKLYKEDDPEHAAGKFRQAFERVNEFLRDRDSKMTEEQRENLRDDRGIYLWELVNTGWLAPKDSIERLKTLRADETTLEDRAWDSQRIVSRADLGRLMIGISSGWIESLGFLPDQEREYEVNESFFVSLDEVANEVEKQIPTVWRGREAFSVRYELALYRFLRTPRFQSDSNGRKVVSAGAIEAARRLADAAAESNRATEEFEASNDEKLSALALYAAALGMLVCMSGDARTSAEFSVTINKGFDAVSKGTYALSDPDSILSLISLYMDCGMAAQAKELCGEALQLISSREALSGFILERTRALFLNCLIEMDLGRPDLGGRGCEALSSYLREAHVPMGCSRDIQLENAAFWGSVAKHQMGQTAVAEDEMAERQKYYERMQRGQIPSRRYLARRVLVSISGWRARFALELDRPISEALDRVKNWEKGLLMLRQREIDTERQLAVCYKLQAEAKLRLGSPEDALAFIENAKLLNEPAARIMGPAFRLLQSELEVLEAEILSFAGKGVNLNELDGAVERVVATIEGMLKSYDVDSFHTVRVRAATAMALAAVVYLRCEDGACKAKARALAAETVEAVLRIKGRTDDKIEAWYSEIAALPKAIALGVWSRTTDGTESKQHLKDAEKCAEKLKLTATQIVRFEAVIHFLDLPVDKPVA